VELGDSPARGSQDALVTIVEWADFQCPYSARVTPTLAALLQTYPREVRLVFKHAPLENHPNALPAALAAEAAKAQGKFWEFHDLAFQHQADLSPGKYEEWARELHLNLDQFRKDRDAPETHARVLADAGYGAKVGVNGTPTFFIDGRQLVGAQPVESFRALVEDELHKAHDLLQNGVKQESLYEKLLDANVQKGALATPGRVRIDIGNSPTQGAAHAPVTIVEFSDFQCPYCGKVHAVLAQLMAKYDGRVRLVWKNQALPLHTNARPAAKAALAAGDQGRFWEMHDMLLSHQDKLDPAYYEAWAHDMSLDVARFKADMSSAKYDAILDADSQLGNSLGASGTPTFFINGQKVLGAIPLEEFERLIDAELAAAK
jgi:protein-disulfide isomerase